MTLDSIAITSTGGTRGESDWRYQKEIGDGGEANRAAHC
jgi:hypothetical protein